MPPRLHSRRQGRWPSDDSTFSRLEFAVFVGASYPPASTATATVSSWEKLPLSVTVAMNSRAASAVNPLGAVKVGLLGQRHPTAAPLDRRSAPTRRSVCLRRPDRRLRRLVAWRDPSLVEALVAGRLVGHVGQRYLDNVVVEIGTVAHSDDHQIYPVIIRVVRNFVVLCGGESQLPRRSDGEMFPVGAEPCQIAVQCLNQKVAGGVLIGSGQGANRRGSFRHRE